MVNVRPRQPGAPDDPASPAELDCRLQAHRRNPAEVVPWQQIKTEAEAKYRGGK